MIILAEISVWQLIIGIIIAIGIGGGGTFFFIKKKTENQSPINPNINNNKNKIDETIKQNNKLISKIKEVLKL